jgi:sec-independent protein translocase protein TatA
MSLGWWEIIIIALVILLLFGGAKQLPELARSLGRAMREFKKSVKELESDVTSDDEQKPSVN